MSITGIAIFLITYVLISARRLSWLGFDRPAGALFGAVACVALGVLTPARAIASVNGATLLLLLGVMGMGAFLAIDGFFDQVEAKLVAHAKTPPRLLAFIVWGAGLLSALITNDAVCVLGAPVVVRLIQKQRLPPLPFLLALATAANTGSVATLVGNPQNMLCGVLGRLSYLDHLLLLGPVALVGLAINHALLYLLFRSSLQATSLQTESSPTTLKPKTKLSLSVLMLSIVVYSAGGDLAWTSVSGFVLLMLLHRQDTRELWSRIDWALLLFFAGLFVVVEGLMSTGLPSAAFEQFPLGGGESGIVGGLRLSGIFLVGSNLVSNVPFILVVRDQMTTIANPRLGWELLAMASTFAGNLTLLGSVANVIVAEAGRDVGGIGFVQYLRVGAPIALSTTLIGSLWLTWLAG